MKLKPRSSKIISAFLLVYIIAFIIFYLLPGFPLFPPRLPHYIIEGIWTLVSIIYIIFALTHNYYEIDKNRIVHYKGRKRLVYDFNSILYIDEEWSKKHKTLLFYTNLGDARYLPFDKKGLIYEKTLPRCKNLISKEEYQKRFPKTKM